MKWVRALFFVVFISAASSSRLQAIGFDSSKEVFNGKRATILHFQAWPLGDAEITERMRSMQRSTKLTEVELAQLRRSFANIPASLTVMEVKSLPGDTEQPKHFLAASWPGRAQVYELHSGPRPWGILDFHSMRVDGLDRAIKAHLEEGNEGADKLYTYFKNLFDMANKQMQEFPGAPVGEVDFAGSNLRRPK